VSWRIAAAITGYLGGNPAEFRDAWEKDRMPSGLRAQEPVVPSLRDLLVRPGWSAEYPLSGADGRDVSVWHAAAGCQEQSGFVHDLAQALEWVLEHERERHSGGS
jgi:hypothetical protein